MHLYFDNYITETPLFKYLYDDLDKIRNKVKTYGPFSRIDVTKYTLASYAKYPWKGVLVKYSLENKEAEKDFSKFVKRCFPRAILINERSDNQKKYQEAYEILESMGEDFVFYAGNNDHPFVCEDFCTLNECLNTAKLFSKRYKFVSIRYSHTLEGAGLIENPNFGKMFPEQTLKRKVLQNGDRYYVCLEREGNFNSTLIVNMQLLHHWFFSKKIPNKKIRRSDDLRDYIKIDKQIVIYPKESICEHFDGYGNLSSRVGFDINRVVPPLFIPPGFFDNKIKIRFGYQENEDDAVNINPKKKRYTFEDKSGADMKIGITCIPLFWKERIKLLDINENENVAELDFIGNLEKRKFANPWPKDKISLHLSQARIPLLKFKKIVNLTRRYIDDVDYLKNVKDDGDQYYRLYKNFLYHVLSRLKG